MSHTSLLGIRTGGSRRITTVPTAAGSWNVEDRSRCTPIAAAVACHLAYSTNPDFDEFLRIFAGQNAGTSGFFVEHPWSLDALVIIFFRIWIGKPC